VAVVSIRGRILKDYHRWFHVCAIYVAVVSIRGRILKGYSIIRVVGAQVKVAVVSIRGRILKGFWRNISIFI
jgi:hypothetical protein